MWGTGSGGQRRPTKAASVPEVSIYPYFLTIPLNCQRKLCLSWHRTGVQLAFGHLEVWEGKDDNFTPNGKLVAGEASLAGNLCQIVCQLDSEVLSPRAGALASLTKEPAVSSLTVGRAPCPPWAFDTPGEHMKPLFSITIRLYLIPSPQRPGPKVPGSPWQMRK